MTETSQSVLDGTQALVRAKFRAFSDILERSRLAFGPEWEREFESLLVHMFPSQDHLIAAFKGYVRFASDSVRLQAAFEKTGRYRGSSYADASANVYQNDVYMMSEYLPGLLLSHFLWPHHYRQLLFFDSAFVRHVNNAGVRRFVEVGVGTGLYSRRLLEAAPGVNGTGYDVSPSAQRFALLHMHSFGLSSRYELHLRDIVANPTEEQFPALICVEVLEHLEDPVGFLRGLRRLMLPGARAFITAAVSADHADHIYLYRKADEVEAHLLEAGFAVEQSFVASAFPPRYPGQPVPVAAAFIAL